MHLSTRLSTRRCATALGLSAALLVAGCSGGDKSASGTGSDEEVFLQPVAQAGPDPFTESTARNDSASPSPVTRSPQPASSEATAPATQQGVRSISGGTPGLYGGTHDVHSCDVEQQVRFLTADQAKAAAFAQVEGIKQSEVAGFLRGLTPVQLRGDTRVTNHGFRDGRATGFQSVLQSGSAVLVDNRGMPRVRCACGNPLTPPAAVKSNARHRGEQWSGYRPAKVVVVTPAPQVINNITIINITNNTWIERPIGKKGKDRVVPPPSPSPTPPPSPTDSSPSPTDSSPSPTDSSPSPTDSSPSPTDPDSDSPPPPPTSASEEVPPPEEESPPPEEESPAPDEQSPIPDEQSPAPEEESPAPEDTNTAPAAPCPTDPIPADPALQPVIPEGCPTPPTQAPPPPPEPEPVQPEQPDQPQQPEEQPQ